jgi:RNA polymerase sigma-70 factor, ECF subfamily
MTNEDEQAAFGELVRRHQARLLRFAIRMCGGEAAEDIVQEAFLRLWGARARYKPSGRFIYLLLRTVHNLCCDQIRRTKPTLPISEADGMKMMDTALEVTVANALLAEVIRDAVAQLPETLRAVFVLSVYEELRYEEIAEILEIPSGTVGSRKNQAIKILKTKLKDWSE